MLKITSNKKILSHLVKLPPVDAVKNRLTVTDCAKIHLAWMKDPRASRKVSYEVKYWLTGQFVRQEGEIGGSFITQMEQGKIKNVIKI